MRLHRRRAPLEHILIAGGLHDLPAIEAVLSTLPANAYGQVVIEADRTLVPALATPPRVTVHAVPIDRLTRAIDCWIAEWMPHDPAADQCDRAVTIWIGGHASASVNAQCVGLGDVVERL